MLAWTKVISSFIFKVELIRFADSLDGGRDGREGRGHQQELRIKRKKSDV
jgi:hypothetical protein